MPKRKLKKRNPKNHTSRTEVFRISYITIGVMVVVLLVVAKELTSGNTTSVLGTNNLLSRGDDSGSETRMEKSESENEHQANIETESTDVKRQLNLKTDGTEVKFQQENGEIQLEGKKADGTEVKLEDDTLDEINDSLLESDFKIEHEASGSIKIKQNKSETESRFPLSIDLATHALLVTTAHDTKTVSILPDHAIQNMLSHNIADRLEVFTSSASATPATTSAQRDVAHVTLTELENKLVYQINGIDDRRFFGLVPVSIKKTVYVSAENGTIVKTDTSLLGRILELLTR